MKLIFKMRRLSRAGLSIFPAILLQLGAYPATGYAESAEPQKNDSPAATSAESSGVDASGITLIPVVLNGGHDTDPRDHGRPVDLIAGALGVTSEVFREAFSKVNPVAPGSRPDDATARRNKEILLQVLAKFEVTKEMLDAVSDRYRYQPGEGRVWPNKPARILAVVKNGDILAFKVTDGGYGYSSAPEISVPGGSCGPISIRLSFGKDMEQNGSISSVDFVP